MKTYKSQTEVDAALARGEVEFAAECYCEIKAAVMVYLSDNARATLSDNASATLSDNASATLSDNARATLYGNARATLYGNASGWCYGGLMKLFGFAVGFAVGGKVQAKVKTAVVQKPKPPATPKEWCDHNGVPIKDGVATVYKCTDDKFGTRNGVTYEPGSKPVAPDWDGGKEECGGGLHFSPTPMHAKAMFSGSKFVRCFVRLRDMRAPKRGDTYPQKIKARGCCRPCVECDEFGDPIGASK